MSRFRMLVAVAVAVTGIAAASTNAARAAQTINVKEVDFKIKFSATPRAGHVKFVVKNAAKASKHDLWIRGGGKTFHTKVLAPGKSATLLVTLKKGVRYTAWCKVDSHVKLGMKRNFVAR